MVNRLLTVLRRVPSVDRVQFVTTRDFWIDSLHLFPLCGFAVAQPIYDLLGQYPEFLAVRGSRPVDIILLVLILSFLIPISLVLVQLAAGLFGRPARKGVQAAIVAGFVAVLTLIIIKKLLEPHAQWMLSISGIVGIVAAYAVLNARPARRFLTILSPSAILFPVLFLAFTPISTLFFMEDVKIAKTGAATSDTPIIFVIFDEFPLSSLMDDNGMIDSVRYPHFAELASQSYWFRNATTISGSTTYAVPAMLTGVIPKIGNLPLYRDHPNNIFSLLGSSHQINSFESVTRLCPASLCPNNRERTPLLERLQSLFADLGVVYLHVIVPIRWSEKLPPVTQTWGQFVKLKKVKRKDVVRPLIVNAKNSRKNNYAQFLDSISNTNQPGLYFIHSHYPHWPWKYLPSGKLYSDSNNRLPKIWGDNEIIVMDSYRRHLLQVGYVDRLLGKLMGRIRTAGLYKRSLIIITSDHGISFRPNETRRQPTDSNFQDIIWVPLFIKTPNQITSAVIDRNVQSIDILPTIADVMDIEIPWKVDGRSALDPDTQESTEKMTYAAGKPGWNVYSSEITPLFESVSRKIAIFGSGNQNENYRFGKFSRLIGTAVNEYDVGTASDFRSVIDQDEMLKQVDLSGQFIPTHITGHMVGIDRKNSVFLILVKDSIIVATTETYNLNDRDNIFSFIVPERIMHEGKNRLDLFIIDSDGAGAVTLQRVSK